MTVDDVIFASLWTTSVRSVYEVLSTLTSWNLGFYDAEEVDIAAEVCYSSLC